MYIVIAGAGLVGRGLAEKLVSAGHDVVVIDQDKDVCEWIASHLGAMTFHGSATRIFHTPCWGGRGAARRG